MKRREFITLLGGAAVAWPLARARTHKSGSVSGSLNVRFAPKATNCCVAAKRRDGPLPDITPAIRTAAGCWESLSTTLSEELT